MKLTKNEIEEILTWVKYIKRFDSLESNFTCNYINVVNPELLSYYKSLFCEVDTELGCWMHYQMQHNYESLTINKIKELNQVRMNMLLLFIEVYR